MLVNVITIRRREREKIRSECEREREKLRNEAESQRKLRNL